VEGPAVLAAKTIWTASDSRGISFCALYSEGLRPAGNSGFHPRRSLRFASVGITMLERISFKAFRDHGHIVFPVD